MTRKGSISLHVSYNVVLQLVLNETPLQDNANATTLEEHGIQDGTTLDMIKRSAPLVLTASGDKTAKIWDTTTGKCKQTLSGHDGAVRSAVFSADGLSVLTGSYDKTAKIWDTTTGECKQTLSGHAGVVTSAVFSADGFGS